MKAKAGLLIMELSVPGCLTLKEKRSVLQPIIEKMRRKFNASVSEIDWLDKHQRSVIGCCVISNDSVHTNRVLQSIVKWLETQKYQIQVIDDYIELL